MHRAAGEAAKRAETGEELQKTGPDECPPAKRAVRGKTVASGRAAKFAGRPSAGPAKLPADAFAATIPSKE